MDQRVETVASFYQRFKARDWSGLRELFADDAEFGLTGRNPVAGTYRGPDSIVEALQRLVEDCALDNGKLLRAFANLVDQYEFDELWSTPRE